MLASATQALLRHAPRRRMARRGSRDLRNGAVLSPRCCSCFSGARGCSRPSPCCRRSKTLWILFALCTLAWRERARPHLRRRITLRGVTTRWQAAQLSARIDNNRQSDDHGRVVRLHRGLLACRGERRRREPIGEPRQAFILRVRRQQHTFEFGHRQQTTPQPPYQPVTGRQLVRALVWAILFCGCIACSALCLQCMRLARGLADCIRSPRRSRGAD